MEKTIMWLLDKMAEAHIQEAQGLGEFDDLPGAGRPRCVSMTTPHVDRQEEVRPV